MKLDEMIRHHGGPAYPHVTDEGFCAGMSRRDYFAAQAVAGGLIPSRRSGFTAADIAEAAYEVAEAMLARSRQIAADATRADSQD